MPMRSSMIVGGGRQQGFGQGGAMSQRAGVNRPQSVASQPWAQRVGPDIVRRIDNLQYRLAELQAIAQDVDAEVIRFNGAGAQQPQLAPPLLKSLREQRAAIAQCANEAESIEYSLGSRFRSSLGEIASFVSGLLQEVDDNIRDIEAVMRNPPVPLVPVAPYQAPPAQQAPGAVDVVASVQAALQGVVASRQQSAVTFQQFASGDANVKNALRPALRAAI